MGELSLSAGSMGRVLALSLSLDKAGSASGVGEERGLGVELD